MSAELPPLGVYSARFRWAILALWTVVFLALGVGGGVLSGGVQTLALSAGFALALLALTAIDLKAHILPDAITLPLLLAGLLASGVTGVGPLWSGLGALAGYGLIALLRWLWIRRTGVEGIGLGDAKMLAAGGAWLGAAGLPFALVIASGTALLSVLVLRPFRAGQALPFGVFLAVGLWASWCFWTTAPR